MHTHTFNLPSMFFADSDNTKTRKGRGLTGPEDSSPCETSSAGGSHLSNSPIQFCKVLTGTMHSTNFADVCSRNMSVKEMACMVFPRPMECARMHPKPGVESNEERDSMMLS